MSSAGTTTAARLLEGRLRALGALVEVLDGDLVRTRLSKGLGYGKEDRDEVRNQIPQFVEVYMECPLDVLIARDVKGLFRKALAGRSRTSRECPIGTSRRSPPR